MKKDLEKKHPEHKVRYLNIPVMEGDVIDTILKRLKKQLNLPRTTIVKNAVLSYNLFVQNSLKERGEKNE